jgi:hypothetical protein
MWLTPHQQGTKMGEWRRAASRDRLAVGWSEVGYTMVLRA